VVAVVGGKPSLHGGVVWSPSLMGAEPSEQHGVPGLPGGVVAAEPELPPPPPPPQVCVAASISFHGARAPGTRCKVLCCATGTASHPVGVESLCSSASMCSAPTSSTGAAIVLACGCVLAVDKENRRLCLSAVLTHTRMQNWPSGRAVFSVPSCSMLPLQHHLPQLCLQKGSARFRSRKKVGRKLWISVFT